MITILQCQWNTPKKDECITWIQRKQWYYHNKMVYRNVCIFCGMKRASPFANFPIKLLSSKSWVSIFCCKISPLFRNAYETEQVLHQTINKEIICHCFDILLEWRFSFANNTSTQYSIVSIKWQFQPRISLSILAKVIHKKLYEYQLKSTTL